METRVGYSVRRRSPLIDSSRKASNLHRGVCVVIAYVTQTALLSCENGETQRESRVVNSHYNKNVSRLKANFVTFALILQNTPNIK